MTVSFLRPLSFNGPLAFITLTRGHIAMIDAADAGLIEGWNWSSLVASNTVYARRNRLVGDGPGPRCILLHRVVMNAPAGMDVDHKDGNGLDNRRCNLRIVTHADNSKNSRLRCDNTSGLKGAFWDKFTRKWMAGIGHEGKFRNLGRFDSREEAHSAYARAAHELFGQFARLS